MRQQLEERDVQQDVQRLLQPLQLRAAGHRPGHAPPLPLLRHPGQPTHRQAQVPIDYMHPILHMPLSIRLYAYYYLSSVM